MTSLILASVGVFLGVILLLVIILLIAKRYLSPSGKVKVTINGEKEVEVEVGSSLLSTLAENKIFLPSACGGGGSCAQCRCQVEAGGGEILPTEKVHFSRKEQQANWRLGCQVKVKQDMEIKVPEAVLGVKKWECEVVSNNNVATFIKEFVVRLPKGEHLNFVSGGYIQIDIPKYDIKYADYEIEDRFRGDWDKFKMWDLTCKNEEETMRAYSMANYPAEGDIVMLNVRIATPPFDSVNEWFCHITLASEELRSEFEYMSDVAGSTPEQYALRVRTHPGVLQISASNKIRRAVNVDISWAGRLVELIS